MVFLIIFLVISIIYIKKAITYIQEKEKQQIIYNNDMLNDDDKYKSIIELN